MARGGNLAEQLGEEETAEFLEELDTGDVDEEDDTGEDEEEDTGEDDDDDTSAPKLSRKVRRKLTVQARALERKNAGRPLTGAQLAAVVATHRKAAARAGARQGARKMTRNQPAIYGAPRPSPKVVQMREDLFATYRRKHPDAVQQAGYYYSTFEVVLSGEGTAITAANAGLFLSVTPGSPVKFKAFDKAIDDTGARGGIANYVWNIGDTNLQYPGKNTYQDELMVIEGVKIEPTGYLVDYDHPTIDALGLTPNQVATLEYQRVFFDDAGIFLPAELYNEFTGESLLLKALFQSATLAFNWSKNQGGGTQGTEEVIVRPLSELVGVRASMRETSGGAVHITADDGYVWAFNLQEAQQNGIFEARLNFYQSLYFPVKAVKIPPLAVNPLAPKTLSQLLRITVYGQTIRPYDATEQVPQRRL